MYLENLEYVEKNGTPEVSTVRTNLMNEKGYAPYCGASWLDDCSCPRAIWKNGQFVCPECGWVSEFPVEFIERYKLKWGIE